MDMRKDKNRERLPHCADRCERVFVTCKHTYAHRYYARARLPTPVTIVPHANAHESTSARTRRRAHVHQRVDKHTRKHTAAALTCCPCTVLCVQRQLPESTA